MYIYMLCSLLSPGELMDAYMHLHVYVYMYVYMNMYTLCSVLGPNELMVSQCQEITNASRLSQSSYFLARRILTKVCSIPLFSSREAPGMTSPRESSGM